MKGTTIEEMKTAASLAAALAELPNEILETVKWDEGGPEEKLAISTAWLVGNILEDHPEVTVRILKQVIAEVGIEAAIKAQSRSS